MLSVLICKVVWWNKILLLLWRPMILLAFDYEQAEQSFILNKAI